MQNNKEWILKKWLRLFGIRKNAMRVEGINYITIKVYEKYDKNVCSNYRIISLLSNTFKYFPDFFPQG